MNNDNSLGLVIENLEFNTNLQEFIENIVEENFTDLEQVLYDEQGNFIYKETIVQILKADEDVASLSNTDFNLLVDLLVKDIIYKIETKGNSHIRATECAYQDEYRSYYGSVESAYWHLLEKYLYDYNYNKSVLDFYDEYLEENNKSIK